MMMMMVMEYLKPRSCKFATERARKRICDNLSIFREEWMETVWCILLTGGVFVLTHTLCNVCVAQTTRRV